jgi:hypothetical protein
MSSFRPALGRVNSVTKRLHPYSPICQRMEPRGYYVEPHAQDLSYLLAVTGPSLKAANSLPSWRKRVQKPGKCCKAAVGI